MNTSQAYGTSRSKDGSFAGAVLAAAGGTLIYRGATGHCPVYVATGLSTAYARSDTRTTLSGPRGINIEEAVTISRPASELYAFWRNNFKPAPGDRGTEVRVRMQYNPPGGKLGHAAAWLFGQEPSQTIREDLRRFKQILETGEIPRAE